MFYLNEMKNEEEVIMEERIKVREKKKSRAARIKLFMASMMTSFFMLCNECECVFAATTGGSGGSGGSTGGSGGGTGGGTGGGGADSIIAPITKLTDLIEKVVAAIGVVIIVKNVMEFAQAYQQQDSATMNSALKGIVAGVIMAAIGTVLSIMGIG